MRWIADTWLASKGDEINALLLAFHIHIDLVLFALLIRNFGPLTIADFVFIVA